MRVWEKALKLYFIRLIKISPTDFMDDTKSVGVFYFLFLLAFLVLFPYFCILIIQQTNKTKTNAD